MSALCPCPTQVSKQLIYLKFLFESLPLFSSYLNICIDCIVFFGYNYSRLAFVSCACFYGFACIFSI